ncbi:hypothetical protein HYR54_07690 [Candidatus Acetothermia bacterium]|nr:hypothetical protein [Candidatus Acetothermia bacterium]
MHRWILLTVAILLPLALTAESCTLYLPPVYTNPGGEWIGIAYLPSKEPMKLALDVFSNGTLNGSAEFLNTGFSHTILDGHWLENRIGFQLHPWINSYEITGTLNPEFTAFETCVVYRWNTSTESWEQIGGCRFNRPLAP